MSSCALEGGEFEVAKVERIFEIYALDIILYTVKNYLVVNPLRDLLLLIAN